MKRDNEMNTMNVKTLLKESILNLFKYQVNYRDKVIIQGHLEISVDDDDTVHVDIDEKLHKNNTVLTDEHDRVVLPGIKWPIVKKRVKDNRLSQVSSKEPESNCNQRRKVYRSLERIDDSNDPHVHDLQTCYSKGEMGKVQSPGMSESSEVTRDQERERTKTTIPRTLCQSVSETSVSKIEDDINVPTASQLSSQDLISKYRLVNSVSEGGFDTRESSENSTQKSCDSQGNLTAPCVQATLKSELGMTCNSDISESDVHFKDGDDTESKHHKDKETLEDSSVLSNPDQHIQKEKPSDLSWGPIPKNVNDTSCTEPGLSGETEIGSQKNSEEQKYNTVALQQKGTLEKCELDSDIFRRERKGMKRKVLSLEDRVKVLKMYDGGKSSRKIAAELDVGKTQIQKIVHSRESIVREWISGGNMERKYYKTRKSRYVELNQLVLQWFYDIRSRNIPVSGRMLQKKALVIAMEQGLTEFTASNGWLEAFNKRNNIKLSIISAEHNDMDKTNTSHSLPAASDPQSTPPRQMQGIL